jgi:hypothetical protein
MRHHESPLIQSPFDRALVRTHPSKLEKDPPKNRINGNDEIIPVETGQSPPYSASPRTGEDVIRRRHERVVLDMT